MKSKTIAVRLEESTYIEVQRLAQEHNVKESAIVAALTTHSVNLIVDNNGNTRIGEAKEETL